MPVPIIGTGGQLADLSKVIPTVISGGFGNAIPRNINTTLPSFTIPTLKTDFLVVAQSKFLNENLLTSTFRPEITLPESLKSAELGSAIGEAVGDALEEAEEERTEVARKAWKGVSEKVQKMWEKTTEFVSDKFSDLKSQLQSDFDEVLGPQLRAIFNTVKNLFKSLLEKFKPLGKWIFDKILRPLSGVALKGALGYFAPRLGTRGTRTPSGPDEAGGGILDTAGTIGLWEAGKRGVGGALKSGGRALSWLGRGAMHLAPLAATPLGIAGIGGVAMATMAKMAVDKAEKDPEYAEQLNKWGSAEAALMTAMEGSKADSAKQTKDLIRAEEKQFQIHLGANSPITDFLKGIWEKITSWMPDVSSLIPKMPSMPNIWPFGGGREAAAPTAAHQKIIAAAGPEKIKQVSDYLASKGFSQVQASGIIGNLLKESGLDPMAYNAKEGAFGIAQWRLDRLENLKKFAAARQADYKDLNVQLDFMLEEMQTSEKQAGDVVRQAKTVQETVTGMVAYERPKSPGKEIAERTALGTGVYEGLTGRAIAQRDIMRLGGTGKYTPLPGDERFFSDPRQLAGLDVEFVNRLRQSAMETGKILPIESGFRSAEYQEGLYKKYVASGMKGAPVAPGGKSFHEAAAIDLGRGWIEQNPDVVEAFKRNKLFQLSELGGRVGMETWHIQPEETKGMTLAEFKAKGGLVGQISDYERQKAKLGAEVQQAQVAAQQQTSADIKALPGDLSAKLATIDQPGVPMTSNIIAAGQGQKGQAFDLFGSDDLFSQLIAFSLSALNA